MRVALIPARGGSRRLPRKNVLPFRGRPMIAWSVKAAGDCGLFDKVVVSTEDSEIAGAGADAGADILDRPVDLSGDDIQLTRVLLHAIDALELSGDADICVLMPNCPLRGAQDISEAHAVHTECGADVCMSVVSYDWRPPQWAMKRSTSGWYERIFEKDMFGPVAASERWVAPCGAIRWARAGRFTAEAGFYPERLAGHELPWQRAIDIDEPEDMEMALCVAHALDYGFKFTART